MYRRMSDKKYSPTAPTPRVFSNSISSQFLIDTITNKFNYVKFNEIFHQIFISPFRTHPSRENSDEFQPSALPLPNNTHSHSANYLSITRLVPTSLAGSYDQLLSNQVNVPLSTSFHVRSQQSSTSKELSPDITITKTTSANFSYVPASDSLVFNNLVGTSLSTLVPLHSTNHKSKNTII